MGRQRGVPNRKTADLMDRAKELGCDPFAILCHFATGNWEALGYKSATRHIATKRGIMEVPVISDEMRIKAASEVSQYMYPKRKAIEIEGSVDVSGDVAITRARVEEALKKDVFTNDESTDEVRGSD